MQTSAFCFDLVPPGTLYFGYVCDDYNAFPSDRFLIPALVQASSLTSRLGLGYVTVTTWMRPP